MAMKRKKLVPAHRQSVLAEGSLDRLSFHLSKRLIFSDNREAQSHFLRLFPADIRSCVSGITKSFNAYRELADSILIEEQPATVMLFCHNASNSLFSSMHLLVSGFPVPAGHLMRQYAESVAMAMLCAVPETGVFLRYAKDKGKYPVHKSVDLITRKEISIALQRGLQLDKRAYAKFAEVMKFYDNLSHVSVITLGHSLLFTETGGLVLGSQFDKSKRKIYQRELRVIQRGCATLSRLVEVLGDVLPKRPQEPSAA